MMTTRDLKMTTRDSKMTRTKDRSHSHSVSLHEPEGPEGFFLLFSREENGQTPPAYIGNHTAAMSLARAPSISLPPALEYSLKWIKPFKAACRNGETEVVTFMVDNWPRDLNTAPLPFNWYLTLGLKAAGDQPLVVDLRTKS